MAALSQPPEAFKFNTASNISITSKHFKQAWSLYEVAYNVQDKEENVRVATFLHVAGKNALDRRQIYPSNNYCKIRWRLH